MAPKPPAKGPAAPQRPPNKLEQCLQSYNCATLGILLLFCLFLYTLWYISLCAVEKAKRDPVRHAVSSIRSYMISRNAEYSSLNDTEILLEAEKYSRELLPWAQKIRELQAEIADLHYKLNNNWLAFNSHLYLLSSDTFDFDNTVKLCNKSKSIVVEIQDEKEEEFLEKAIRRKHGHYYIGLTYREREWKWNATLTRAFRTFWMDRHPYDLYHNKCSRIESGCNNRFRCWASVHCNTESRGICKRKPEDKWMV